MDTQALHVALQQSFSADASLRDPAEKAIKDLKYVKGAPCMLLQVAAEKQVQYEVRQAAAINLKNLCRECWAARSSLHTLNGEEGNEFVLLDEQDKAGIRLNLVESLLNETETSVRDLMAETIHTIAIHDFPDNWPNLLPTLLQTISQSSDPSQALRVHNALLALRKVCKRYEYKSRDQRGPLNEIVLKSFPLLLPLAQRLSNPNEHSLEAALMLKQILKIFFSSTQFYLPGEAGESKPSPLANEQVMQPWFDVLQASLSKPLPEANTGQEPLNQPTDVDDRNAWPWWKVKKWTVQIMSRMFSRYGIPSYAEDEIKDFATYFSIKVAPQFLKPICETLNMRPSGQFCTDRVVHLCLSFVDISVELASTYKMLKPNLDFLLYKVCFPTICLNVQDIELFQNDPHEFVHRQNSPMADFYDPRMSAITLVTDLVKHRGKDVTKPLLTFLNENLLRYNAADDTTKNHIEKDGSLLAIGSLSDNLLAKKNMSKDLEGLLVTHVFPEFSSPIGFLRCRACWMAQQFASVKWTDDGTGLRTLINLVLQRLSDPELPVQIEASKALRYLIDTDGAEQTILPVLPDVLNEYFRIMNEIGNDDVVAALQVIIDKFGEHIEPHATALVTQLSNAFKTYCSVGEDDDDDAAMAAAQCLDCISTVLKGVCDRPDLFKHLEPQLLPIVIQILGNEGEYIEYLEHALDILTFLTYFPDQISPQLWETFPLIYNAFDQWAFDYLNLMTPSLENFIGKAPQQFLSGKIVMADKTVSYIELIFNMVTKTLAEDRTSEGEVRKAISLYLSILHNCRGMVDGYLSAINDVVLKKLAQQLNAETPLTRIAIYQVIGSALYYNPQLQLIELEKRNATQQVFFQWLKDLEKIDRWLPRKITVLGFLSILQLPISSLPVSVSSVVPQIMTGLITTTEKMQDDAELEEDEKSESVIESESVCLDDDSEGFAEDEDVHSGEDEAYLDALNTLSSGNELHQFLVGEDWDDDDDDENYKSPLDDIDELYFFSDTLKASFLREPQVYQQIQTALSPEVLNSCQRLFAAADTQRAKDALQAQSASP